MKDLNGQSYDADLVKKSSSGETSSRQMGDQQIESQMIDDGPDMGGKNVHYYYGPKRMIETALDTLPNKRGTLKDIF